MRPIRVGTPTAVEQLCNAANRWAARDQAE